MANKYHLYYKPCFDTEAEAEKALDTLINYIVVYGYTTVADVKSLCLIEEHEVPNDHLYGWVNLADAIIKRGTGKSGYYIKLPKAMQLK